MKSLAGNVEGRRGMVLAKTGLIGGGIFSTALLGSLLQVYVIYDSIVSEDMILFEKLLWIALASWTGLVGVAVYLYLVEYRGETMAGHRSRGHSGEPGI